MSKVCEILGVVPNVNFNIVGQNLSNPYRFVEDKSFTVLYTNNGEEAHNWIVCNLIDGKLEIERNETKEKIYPYMFYGADLCPNDP